METMNMKKNMIRLLGAFCAVSSLVLATGCIEIDLCVDAEPLGVPE